jgi:tetraacyldisaccharide 4'-kinase
VAGAFCGLGNPASFRKTLEGLGIEIADWRTFADHHAYSSTDIQDLRRWAETLPKDALVLTTQKDAVKLRITELAGRELWSLRIGLELQSSQERDELHRRLNEVMKT